MYCKFEPHKDGVRCSRCGTTQQRDTLRNCRSKTRGASVTKANHARPNSTTPLKFNHFQTTPTYSYGPGAELKRLLSKFKLFPKSGCKCDQRALAMDEQGNDWCEQNIETIVDWLQEEAQERKLPFVRWAGKVLVKRAISNSRKKLKAAQPS